LEGNLSGFRHVHYRLLTIFGSSIFFDRGLEERLP